MRPCDALRQAWWHTGMEVPAKSGEIDRLVDAPARKCSCALTGLTHARAELGLYDFSAGLSLRCDQLFVLIGGEIQ